VCLFFFFFFFFFFSSSSQPPFAVGIGCWLSVINARHEVVLIVGGLLKSWALLDDRSLFLRFCCLSARMCTSCFLVSWLSPFSLQILADSFNKRFMPVSLELPRALVPLVNVPLIDYSIEMLMSSGIETIYVVCVTHADKIQAHVNASQWAANIKCIVSTTAQTVGDALRRIQDENVIETDFVLCHADVVGNIPLQHILTQHRLRKVEKRSFFLFRLTSL
jgi:hypothetical protein